MLDVLFPTFNRLEFTKFSFQMLVENTNWGLVENLVVVDDGSTDGTRDWLADAIPRVRSDVDADIWLHHTDFRSPVEVMNFYLERFKSDLFAKVDNDIFVPYGWLERMKSTMDRNPDLEILGMAAGWVGDECEDGRGYVTTSHIGGVGMMRTKAFTSRPPMRADGRFGFTLWQEKYEPLAGWICPDLNAVEPLRGVREEEVAAQVAPL
jgi:glycosyltransferase involved in cell wall biosynthesis